MKKRWWFSIVGVFALCWLLSCKKKSSDEMESANKSNEIFVGQVDAFTGSQGNFGVSSRTGMEMAFEKVNRQGGILGKKVRLLSKDDQGKPEEAKKAAQSLIKQDGVVAILGASASSRSLAMAPIAQTNKIPMISHSSTNPKVTHVGDYIFRVCFIDTFQGPVMARFVVEILKLKNVAILRDIESEYSLGLAQFFKQKMVDLKGQIVADESYQPGEVDFRPQLTSIWAKKPQLIYVPGYYTDAANIIIQARKLGINVPFAGGDGWDATQLYELGGQALEGSYFSTHYSQSNQDPLHLKFLEEYRSKYGAKAKIDGGLALGYDAAMVLLTAMKRAKSLDGPDLRDAIAQTKEFPGVTGMISLDENRNAVKSAVILRIQKKRAQYVRTISP